MENLYEGIGTCTHDNLIAGNQMPILTSGVTLVSGQGVLARGTVIGKVTATGKFKVVDSAASDGSQVPYGILTDTVDTTAEVTTTAYVSGLFNINALTFGGTDTASTHETELRKLGIFLKNVI